MTRTGLAEDSAGVVFGFATPFPTPTRRAVVDVVDEPLPVEAGVVLLLLPPEPVMEAR